MSIKYNKSEDIGKNKTPCSRIRQVWVIWLCLFVFYIGPDEAEIKRRNVAIGRIREHWVVLFPLFSNFVIFIIFDYN